MLLRFIVENFGSIKDRCEFSMMASKVARHPSHVCEADGKRILRSSFIFGANASGKTSFFKAIEFAVGIVTKGIGRVDCNRRNFRLSTPINQEGLFQFDFTVDSHIYSYGFVVSYSTASVVAEWLYLCDDPQKDICVFNREFRNGKLIVETAMADAISNSGWFDFYKDDFIDGDNSPVLILRDLSRKSSIDNAVVMHAIVAKKWFRKFVFVSPEQVYNGGLYLQGDSASKKELESYLRRFDTGITKIHLKDVSYDDVAKVLPTYIREDLQHDLKMASEKKLRRITASVSNNKTTYFFSFEKSQINVRQLMFEHGLKGELFERMDESDGTRRLFDLLPLLLMLRTGAIVVVDEIDRSLHTKATTEFVQQFLSQDARVRSQLIATTHDGEILDLDLLRQDEIWFIERDNDFASHLFPLSKFKARFDKDIKKEYLLGRYGALPIFGRMESVES